MPLGSTLQGLTTLAVIIVAALATGKLFGRLGHPKVLGPITLGIAVGASVIALPEAIGSELISQTSRLLIEEVGTAGLLLLMFAVGTELRTAGASEEASTFGWRLAPCVVLPTVIGALAAWPFAGRLGVSGDTGPHGWLFVGIALGVTAVPVLVTIVRDLGITTLPIARAALRIAIVTDGLAWILVTVLVIAATDVASVSIPALGAGAALLVAVTVVLPRAVEKTEASSRGGVVVGMMVICALAGAAATQFLGFHPAIGAVIAGFRFPAGLVATSSQRTFSSVVDVLLPAFFVSVAMAVPLQALRDQMSWAAVGCVAVLVVAAAVSKMAAAFVFGAMHRWGWRSAAQLGVLLNCRGVTEIAIASVGFQAGLIGPFAFAALCGIAVVTTGITAPLYRLLAGDRDVVPDGIRSG